MTERPDKTQRNELIVQKYQSGHPIEELCLEYKITRSRIFQILKKAGVPRERHGPQVGRDQFLGVNLSEPVKDALRAEANRRGISMSSLSYDMLKEMLITLGYPLEAERVAS